MAIGNAGLAARLEEKTGTAIQRKRFLSRYSTSACRWCLGTGGLALQQDRRRQSVHAKPPTPLLLWMHGAAFSTWIVFFIAQSALVRVHKVTVHRTLGWFAAGLATVMVVLGVTIAIVMTRFDTVGLHQGGVESFLSIPFGDILVFGTLVAHAMYWRKKPEYHRRLVFYRNLRADGRRHWPI